VMADPTGRPSNCDLPACRHAPASLSHGLRFVVKDLTRREERM
jgi:hypothetical protein